MMFSMLLEPLMMNAKEKKKKKKPKHKFNNLC